MNRAEFIDLMNANLKLVRTEFGLTQEKMATMIGISKKSLVESEKGRRPLAWNEAALFAAIFSKSVVLQNAVGGDALELVEALAFEDSDYRLSSTMGGKIWWRVIETHGKYKIQQNLISNHYRLLDDHDRRYISSFHLDEVKEYLEAIDK